jgi:NAD+ kinase
MIEKVGIIYNPGIAAAVSLVPQVESILKNLGVNVWDCPAIEIKKAVDHINGTGMMLSIGGDGTILRAAQAVAGVGIPICGINLGKLGFMTELSVAEVPELLPRIIAGEGWYDQRAVLEALVTDYDQAGSGAVTYYALNDIVVARGAVARIINIDTYIDEEFFTNYRADGVIMATATGSTAYALANGGPVLNPKDRSMVLTPILPHLHSTYNMVLPETSTVKLEVSSRYPATLSVDGNINLPLADGARVRVRLSEVVTNFLRIHKKGSFYATFEQKLKGKQSGV